MNIHFDMELKMHNLKHLLIAAAVAATSAILPYSLHAATDLQAHGDHDDRQSIDGVIRISGDHHAASLLKHLQTEYSRTRPGVRFHHRLRGNASAIYGLEQRTADIAIMSRRISPFELYGTYERSWTYPVEIEIATGSHQSADHAGAWAVFVHQDNPIESITIPQLDGIFGAQRNGGWDGLKWDASVSREADQNIRSWDLLGIKGELGTRTIHAYGPPIMGTGTMSDFQARVLRGSAMWNEELREYLDGRTMLDALSRDRQGIAYATMDQMIDGVKVVAVAQDAGKPAIRPTRDAVSKREYPLSRTLYLYYTIDDENGNLVGPAPQTADFIRFTLSEAGQKIIEAHAAYNRLDREKMAAQIAAMNTAMTQGAR